MMVGQPLGLAAAFALLVPSAPAVAAAQGIRPLPTAAAAADAAAIGRAIEATYAVISGPAGQKRDWARMRTLFTPDARLYAIGPRGLSGGSLDDYITRSGPQLEKVGFVEKELTRRVEIFGNLAQAWSSYAGSSSDGSVNVRGINSFQLVRQSDGRWLVHSILWQAERPDLPLPADMEASRK
jgi:hypothetical protein